MEDKKKKRVAHLGQHLSIKKSKTEDVVSDIFKQMDAYIDFSNNPKLNEILKSTNLEKKSDSVSKPSVTTQSGMTSSQKKFLRSSRHPLMEKVQKNVNYIKHNRSMPKPRAHLGGLDELKSKLNCKMNAAPKASTSKLKKTSIKSVPVASKNIKSKVHTDNTQFDESDCDVNSKCSELTGSSSDSELDFETFIKSQKQDIDEEKPNTSNRKGRGKPRKGANRKNDKCSKQKQSIKKKIPKPQEIINDDELLNKQCRILRGRKVVTNTNRLILSDSSDSSDESDKIEDEGKVEKPEKINLMEQCSVRIERCKSLDEKVDGINSPLQVPNHNHENNFELQNITSDGNNEKDILEPEEECMIVCEIPKSNSDTVDVSGAESVDCESDIQILNVVSLKKGDSGVTDKSNKLLNTSDISDKGFQEINYNKLKEALQIAQKGEKSEASCSSLHKEILNSGKGYINSERNIRDGADYNLNLNNEVPVPAHIVESINKIDLKKILLLTKNEKEENNTNIASFPCSSSFSGETLVHAKLPSNYTETIPENDWRNIKQVVDIHRMNYSVNGTTSTSDFFGIPKSLPLVKPESQSNFISHDISTHPTSTISTSLTSSALKEIISNAERLQGQIGELFQSANSNNYQIEENLCKNSSGDLDVLATASLQEMSQSHNGQNLLQLLNMLIRANQEYNEIKKYEENYALGLTVLKECEERKKKSIETVMEHIMKHDPCLYSQVKASEHRTDNTHVNQNPEILENHSLKKCISCGLNATIECGKCKKIFFCSETCGVDYWEKGHYKECGGLTQKKEEKDK